ncbi:MAG: DUF58 domain-containing protein [Lachnospiraceae bacterium]|nr:DUF58 domain-containing protein [Lachnospiraceae bacterium]
MADRIIAYVKYIIILFALTVLYLFNNHAITLALLIVAVLVPIVSGIGFFQSRESLSAGLSFHTYFINRGSTAKLTFRVTNASFYPHTNVKLRFRIHHLSDETSYEQEITFLALPKKEQEHTLTLTLHNCGVFRAELIGIRTSGLFRLAGTYKTLDSSAEIVVMPVPVDLSDSVSDVNRQVNEEEDLVSELGKGDNRTEIYDIREYKPGDELTTIHWKLSAKAEDLMVKEFSEVFGEQFSVFLEIGYEDYSQMNGFYDLLYTVITFFLQQKLRFSVSYPDTKGDYVKIPIEHEEDIIQLLLRLFFENRTVKQESSEEETVPFYTPHSGYMVTCKLHSKFEGTELVMNHKNLARLYRITR